ncbi:unnamed protein product [Didymodactylos carnosus]|uniref:Headcase middle domain-containing protein n=1 Tax=Didymodactylos carnosus TaxID=1234261 RepID=A0A813NRA5_9BILA|nr:unnamed protein product [Didymodactylos carnosus]CAF0844609.1 unnamed protein product [Didymodactylos carnosus]CAF3522343.1 unnamed protein product [Didymodactylos carnosus]CAF3629682.1 unnamed protein product [Didymodactylos carnosus]
MSDSDKKHELSQPLNVPRTGRSSRYRTQSTGSLSSSLGSPGGNVNGSYSKKSTSNNSSNSNTNTLSLSTSNASAIGNTSGGGNNGTLPQFDEKHAAAGNIFEHRQDWSILNRLPLHKRNAIHIRLEDEGPYGNDETRCFVLSQLSIVGCTELNCIVCHQPMIVYDRYPLVDGTLFLSPVKHSENPKVSVGVYHNDRQLYLHSICLDCLSMRTVLAVCRSCKTKFNFDPLIIGTMYYYDLFAAFPCCQQRLQCSSCGHIIIQIKDGLQYFSAYSQEYECTQCGSKQCHFVKVFDDTFEKRQIQKT